MHLANDENFQVDYYLSAKIASKLEVKDGASVTIVKDGPVGALPFEKMYDHVIIGTAHRYFNYWNKIVQRCPTSIIVHNINFSRAKPKALFEAVFVSDIKYRIKLLLKEGLLKSTKVYRLAKNKFVLDQSMSNNEFKYLPLFYNKTIKSSESNDFTIVLPGEVSEHRREYSRVIAKLREWRKSDFQKEFSRFGNSDPGVINVVFLGKASSQFLGDLHKLREEKKGELEIHFFDSKVDSTIFSSWMTRASVLWSPIKEKSHFFDLPEFYGKTKMTGAVGDAIAFGKPLVLPSFVQSGLSFIVSEGENILESLVKASLNDTNFQEDYSYGKVHAWFVEIIMSL